LGEGLHRTVETLSGGQAARVRLAALLLARFEVFCLDEPTNDLDFAGLDRLERFVDTTRASLVVVSPHHAVLDHTVTRIVEIEEGSGALREWAGSWSEYVADRERARERQYRRFAEAEERRRGVEALLGARRGEARTHGRGADRRGTNALRGKVRQ